MPRRLTTLFARSPLWLLIVAWFCANSPQELTLHVFEWAGQARHFSHQASLRADVSRLLAGNPERPVCMIAERAPDTPDNRAAPHAELVVNKLLYTIEARDALTAPDTGPTHTARGAPPRATVRADDVPHPPPRA